MCAKVASTFLFSFFFSFFYFLVLCLIFVCIGEYQFEATLGARNGVPKRHYKFRVMKSNRNNGKFSTVMINRCRSLGAGMQV